MQDEEVVTVLNDLIETCKDGEAGFHTCADGVEAMQLQRFFENRAQSCASAAEDLQQMVKSFGGHPGDHGGIVGLLHRRWIDLKSILSHHDETEVLEECVRGEGVALSDYHDALEKDLPSDVRAVVERQYRGVLHNFEEIKRLRDQYRASV